MRPATAVAIAAALLGLGWWLAVRAASRPTPPDAAATPHRLTVAFSGEDDGRLEPCGCTPAMLGGLTRRPARLLASAEAGVPTVFVSGGDLVEGADAYDGLRLSVMLRALASMGCAAYAPSARERGVLAGSGVAIPRTLAVLDPSRTAAEPVAAVDGKPCGAFVAEVTAGATAESVAALREGLPDGAALVLLTDLGDADARRAAAQLKAPTLVLFAAGRTDPRADDVANGPVALAPYPAHGKFVGVAHLSGEGASARWDVEYRPVVPQFPEDRAVAAMHAEHLEELRKADIVAKSAALARFAVGAAPQTGEAFAGTESCAPCHAAEAAASAATRHARALATLASHGDDADPACVRCHVVGYGTGRGFVSAATTPSLANVGCEACHGPRASHVEARRSGVADERRPPAGEASCAGCHDGEHSPNFVFADAWPRIVHGRR